MQPYEFELSPKVAETLIAMVDLAKANKVMTLTCYQSPGLNVKEFNVSIDAGNEEREIVVVENPLPVLAALELIQLYPSGRDSELAILTKAGHEWANYHKKGKFARWWHRRIDNLKSISLLLVTVLVSLVAFLLTLLELVREWKGLTAP